jgi:hypothetical protein
MSVLAVRIKKSFNLDIYVATCIRTLGGAGQLNILPIPHQHPNFTLHTSSKKMAGPIFSHLKLEGFDLTQTDYKQIGEHGIRADILVPRTLHTGKRPVLIRLHGGGLVRYLMEIQFYLQQL